MGFQCTDFLCTFLCWDLAWCCNFTCLWSCVRDAWSLPQVGEFRLGEDAQKWFVRLDQVAITVGIFWSCSNLVCEVWVVQSSALSQWVCYASQCSSQLLYWSGVYGHMRVSAPLHFVLICLSVKFFYLTAKTWIFNSFHTALTFYMLNSPGEDVLRWKTNAECTPYSSMVLMEQWTPSSKGESFTHTSSHTFNF